MLDFRTVAAEDLRSEKKLKVFDFGATFTTKLKLWLQQETKKTANLNLKSPLTMINYQALGLQSLVRVEIFFPNFWLSNLFLLYQFRYY